MALDIQSSTKSGIQVGLFFFLVIFFFRMTLKPDIKLNLGETPFLSLFNGCLMIFYFFRFNLECFCMSEIDLSLPYDSVYLTDTSGNPIFGFSHNIFTRYPLLSAVLGQTISVTHTTGCAADRTSLNWSIFFLRKSVVTIRRYSSVVSQGQSPR